MITRSKAWLLAALFVVFFLIWSLLAWLMPDQRADYVKFVVSITTGVIALILRDMQAPPPPNPDPQPPASPASTPKEPLQ